MQANTEIAPHEWANRPAYQFTQLLNEFTQCVPAVPIKRFFFSTPVDPFTDLRPLLNSILFINQLIRVQMPLEETARLVPTVTAPDQTSQRIETELAELNQRKEDNERRFIQAKQTIDNEVVRLHQNIGETTSTSMRGTEELANQSTILVSKIRAVDLRIQRHCFSSLACVAKDEKAERSALEESLNAIKPKSPEEAAATQAALKEFQTQIQEKEQALKSLIETYQHQQEQLRKKKGELLRTKQKDTVVNQGYITDQLSNIDIPTFFLYCLAFHLCMVLHSTLENKTDKNEALQTLFLQTTQLKTSLLRLIRLFWCANSADMTALSFLKKIKDMPLNELERLASNPQQLSSLLPFQPGNRLLLVSRKEVALLPEIPPEVITYAQQLIGNIELGENQILPPETMQSQETPPLHLALRQMRTLLKRLSELSATLRVGSLSGLNSKTDLDKSIQSFILILHQQMDLVPKNEPIMHFRPFSTTLELHGRLKRASDEAQSQQSALEKSHEEKKSSITQLIALLNQKIQIHADQLQGKIRSIKESYQSRLAKIDAELEEFRSKACGETCTVFNRPLQRKLAERTQTVTEMNQKIQTCTAEADEKLRNNETLKKEKESELVSLSHRPESLLQAEKKLREIQVPLSTFESYFKEADKKMSFALSNRAGYQVLILFESFCRLKNKLSVLCQLNVTGEAHPEASSIHATQALYQRMLDTVRQGLETLWPLMDEFFLPGHLDGELDGGHRRFQTLPPEEQERLLNDVSVLSDEKIGQFFPELPGQIAAENAENIFQRTPFTDSGSTTPASGSQRQSLALP